MFRALSPFCPSYENAKILLNSIDSVLISFFEKKFLILLNVFLGYKLNLDFKSFGIANIKLDFWYVVECLFFPLPDSTV
jgi:hypothetical protein